MNLNDKVDIIGKLRKSCHLDLSLEDLIQEAFQVSIQTKGL
jgi:hypothetical protein